jgi:hypothetical protein
MRLLLGPIATTLLVLTCGACGSDSPPPTVDAEKQAEINRLRTVSEAYRLITAELTGIGKGQGIEGAESSARTLKYSVTLSNPTEYEHLVIYSANWSARSFIPDNCSLLADGLFPRENWPDRLMGSEVLQPFESVTRSNEFSPFSDCFDFDLTWSAVFIQDIDGVSHTFNIDQRIAELEGREYGY